MGKIKTVVMGDVETEEAARKKAEVKREQRAAQKRAKKELSVLGSQLSDTSLSVVGQPVEGTEKLKTEKQKSENRKLKTDNRYRFSPGKKYSAARSLVDPKKSYPLPEAIALVKKTSYSKFDGSVEVHFNVTDKNLRGTVTLPHGTGKSIRVKIADDALIANPVIDFDVLVASPEMMPKLAKIAKILGPKGLMPNPKTGTIGDDPESLAESLAKGLQWKTQPDFPVVHAVIGKVSSDTKKLAENLAALTKSIGEGKIQSAFIKATMGPSIKVTLV